MSKNTPFGARSTADQVLAGIDLSGRTMVVTGCDSGLGFETLSALTANGAHVFGLARSLEAARTACTEAGPFTTPLACDLGDLDSVAAAAEHISERNGPIDAIVANAAVAALASAEIQYGLERQFLVNHLGHAALIRALVPRMREGSGRIVLVSAGAALSRLPPEGIMFDNLDAHRVYDPRAFYAQSKLANALYASELARRLAGRGIAVNAVDPGPTRGTGIHRHASLGARLLWSAARPFLRSPAQGAATQALLAASPRADRVSGEFWRDCRSVDGHPLIADRALAARLWGLTEDILGRRVAGRPSALAQAA